MHWYWMRWAWVSTLMLFGCGPSQVGEGGYLLAPLTIHTLEPADWLLGTRVQVVGTGFVWEDVGSMTATIEARSGTREVAVRVDLGVESAERASFVVNRALYSLLPVDGEPLVGSLKVERMGPRGVAGSATIPIQVSIVSSLQPSLVSLTPAEVYPGEEVTVTGSGFLFPGEGHLDHTGSVRYGTTWVRFEGRILGDESGPVRDLAVPLSTHDRHHASFRLTPDLMGLGPFVFEGDAEVRNVFTGADDSVETPGNRLEGLVLRMGRTRLTGLSPALVRRGQEIVFHGNGFLPADGGLGTLTFIAFTGTEVGSDGGSSQHGLVNPLLFVPDAVIGNTTARLVLRTLVGPDLRPTGLGSRPVTLNGIFTPHVVFRDRVTVGEGIQTTLEVGRTVQVVWLRFLPTFEDGLETFGLRDVADAVKARALAVCSEDYRGLSVEFRTTRPEDFVEYLTVEVMARDPNDAGLLGLDNSFGKDVGNLILDERIGGYNARSDEAGFYPFGGVFVESFQFFSPRLAKGPAQEFASPLFDAVFSPVMPALGGQPARPDEVGASGARGEAVLEAIRVLGNLLGDTISHEVGHALGLAAVEGDVHNPGDNPGYIMDSGVFRPFEERAQLPGAFPRVFAPYDRAYLEEILPVD